MDFNTPFRVRLSDGRTWWVEWKEGYLESCGSYSWKPLVSDLANVNNLRCPKNFYVGYENTNDQNNPGHYITYHLKTTKGTEARDTFTYVGKRLDQHQRECNFLQHTGILTWIRVRWSGELLIGELETLSYTPGQTTVRRNVLHISMMYKKDVDETDDDYVRLTKFIAKWKFWKITKIPLISVLGRMGSFCQISPRWIHYNDFRFVQQKGRYANRDLHCSLLH